MTSPSRPSVMLALGRVIDDRYRLTELLGEGEMGAVYRAERPDGPPAAVKILHEDLGTDPAQRERFEREARALFALAHPNILAVHDFGVTEGSPYLAMELLEGMSLDRYLEEQEPPPNEALDLVAQVLEGLAFAHGRGVLHRDLKSENVFVTHGPDGRPMAKLLDFGLVKFVDDERWGAGNKLTVMGSVFGTPAYMAPEQCAGAPVTAAADVYAAGVILFEALTGEWPFMEESRLNMFKAHLTAPVPALRDTRQGLWTCDELEALTRRALAKLADDRFPDAGAMLEALRALPSPAARLATAEPSTPTPGPRRPPTALLLGLAVGVPVLLAALAVAAFFLLR